MEFHLIFNNNIRYFQQLLAISAVLIFSIFPVEKQQTSPNGKLSSSEQAKSRGPLPPPRMHERATTLLDLMSESGTRPSGSGSLSDYGAMPVPSKQMMPLDTSRLFKLRYSPLKAHGSQHSFSKSQNGLTDGTSSPIESVKVQSAPLVQLPPAVTFDSSAFADPRRTTGQSQAQSAQLQSQSQGRTGFVGRQTTFASSMGLSGGGPNLFSMARPMGNPNGLPATLKLSHSVTNLTAAEQPTRFAYSKLWPFADDANASTKPKHRLSLRNVNEVRTFANAVVAFHSYISNQIQTVLCR